MIRRLSLPSGLGLENELQIAPLKCLTARMSRTELQGPRKGNAGCSQRDILIELSAMCSSLQSCPPLPSLISRLREHLTPPRPLPGFLMTLGFVLVSEEDSVLLSILCPEWMKVESHLNGCPSFSRNSTVLCQALPCDVPSTLSSPRDSQDLVPHMLWPLL